MCDLQRQRLSQNGLLVVLRRRHARRARELSEDAVRGPCVDWVSSVHTNTLLSATYLTAASVLPSSACKSAAFFTHTVYNRDSLRMYDHIDGGATHPLHLEQELQTLVQGPNRGISVALYSDFHREVVKCLAMSSNPEAVARRIIAHFVDNGSTRRAAELRWLDYAEGSQTQRFATEGRRGPASERNHFIGTVLVQVGPEAVTMLKRLWDECQPLVWEAVSQGCHSSVDIALGHAVFDEALALEETVARVRAQRGSFMCRGQLCDRNCTESHFGATCARCARPWQGEHNGHTCLGGMALVESA